MKVWNRVIKQFFSYYFKVIKDLNIDNRIYKDITIK